MGSFSQQDFNFDCDSILDPSRSTVHHEDSVPRDQSLSATFSVDELANNGSNSSNDRSGGESIHVEEPYPYFSHLSSVS